MPPTDTQESPNAPKKSKMAILQPDIMFEIADILQREEFPKESPVISRLSLINKHWGTHMKQHPLFSAAHFNLTRPFYEDVSKRASLEDVEKWLMHPYRRHRVIHSFSIYVNLLADYEAIRHLLDNQLSDVKFNTFKVGAWDDRPRDGVYKEVQFPRSLKARQLTVLNHRLYRGFNWESLNTSSRDNLVSLDINDKMFDPHNHDLTFKSLKKLSTDFIEYAGIHKWNDFLRRHSSISELSIHGSNCIGGSSISKHRLPLRIDSLDKLETLRTYRIPVDTESWNIQREPLESLTSSVGDYPTQDWTILSSTLKTLVIDARNGYCDWEQDLLNPKMLCKLNNIKHFRLEGTNWIPKFSEAFKSGLYDNAMPLIEDFELCGSSIPKKALNRFVGKHKRLCRIEVQGNKIRCTGNLRKVCL